MHPRKRVGPRCRPYEVSTLYLVSFSTAIGCDIARVVWVWQHVFSFFPGNRKWIYSMIALRIVP